MLGQDRPELASVAKRSIGTRCVARKTAETKRSNNSSPAVIGLAEKGTRGGDCTSGTNNLAGGLGLRRRSSLRLCILAAVSLVLCTLTEV
jgi:hypothetical protein